MEHNEQLLYKRQADVVKALAHPLRIAIVDFLRNGEQCVCDIAEFVGSERTNVSKHLSVMVSAGLLDYHKNGLKVIYRLRCPCAVDFLRCVTAVLKEQAKDTEKLMRAL
jgi:DNA-binding transcriptional ArsR family regulator